MGASLGGRSLSAVLAEVAQIPAAELGPGALQALQLQSLDLARSPGDPSVPFKGASDFLKSPASGLGDFEEGEQQKDN